MCNFHRRHVLIKSTTGSSRPWRPPRVAVFRLPLNVYKKVSVIRKSNDRLTYEDGEGTVKSLSIKELGDAIATG
jgi:hypothetical protein